MNLSHMERIVIIAEEGTITEAAKKLYVSQPTLSLMISSVEKELGFKIFDRRAHSLQLTQAGKKYIDTIKSMLNLWRSFKNDMENIKQGTTGNIILGISLRRSITMLPKLLPPFLQKHPLININVVECISSVAETLLTQGAIDIAFGNYPIFDKATTNIQLVNEYLFIVAHKNAPFAKRLEGKQYTGGSIEGKAVSIAEVRAEKIIILSHQAIERALYEHIIQEACIFPFAPIEVYTSKIAECLVEQDIGIALLPIVMTRDMQIALRNENLAYFAIDSAFATRKFYMSYDKSANLTDAHTNFIAMVIETFGSNEDCPMIGS